MLAASHGRIKTMELLLACEADVNIQVKLNNFKKKKLNKSNL